MYIIKDVMTLFNTLHYKKSCLNFKRNISFFYVSILLMHFFEEVASNGNLFIKPFGRKGTAKDSRGINLQGDYPKRVPMTADQFLTACYRKEVV